jgi:hypothetical protein
MTRRDEVLARWESRQAEWARLHVTVDGATLAAEVLDDLRGILDDDSRTPLTLAEASTESGFSKDRLRHLVAEGRLHNVGRKGAPRVRRGDLPRKRRKQTSFDASAAAQRILRDAVDGPNA